MIGAHGMVQGGEDKSQYGFLYVETEPLELWYFEECTTVDDVDNYSTILDCVTSNGAGGCKHLAEQWF